MGIPKKQQELAQRLRIEARSAGERYYTTGIPCKNGHIERRFVKGGGCLGCNRDRVAVRYRNDPLYAEKVRATASKHAKSAQAKFKKKYHSDEVFRRKIIERTAKLLKQSPVAMEKRRASSRRWAQQNPEALSAQNAYRRAAKRERTIALDSVHRQQMREIFRTARRLTSTTHIPHEVDHEIPLLHPLVCGLHVPWNLQILTQKANREKHNRFDPCEWADVHPLIGTDVRPLFYDLAKDLA